MLLQLPCLLGEWLFTGSIKTIAPDISDAFAKYVLVTQEGMANVQANLMDPLKWELYFPGWPGNEVFYAWNPGRKDTVA